VRKEAGDFLQPGTAYTHPFRERFQVVITEIAAGILYDTQALMMDIGYSMW
jgi:hypothetical protein